MAGGSKRGEGFTDNRFGQPAGDIRLCDELRACRMPTGEQSATLLFGSSHEGQVNDRRAAANRHPGLAPIAIQPACIFVAQIPGQFEPKGGGP
jgi:hypothetical protein